MIDVVTVGAGGGSIAWISPEGALGPQSAGADPGPLCLRQGRHRADHHRRPRHPRSHPPHLLGGEIPLDVDAARRGIPGLAGATGSRLRALCHRHFESRPGTRPCLRQVSVKRGPDVRDFRLTTFGGSGSLLACRLVDILDLAGVVVPEPRQRQRLRPCSPSTSRTTTFKPVLAVGARDFPEIQAILDDLTARRPPP